MIVGQGYFEGRIVICLISQIRTTLCNSPNEDNMIDQRGPNGHDP